MMEDDSGDDLLLACLSPRQDVVDQEGNQILPLIDGDTSLISNTIDATSAGVRELTNEILQSPTHPRQECMDYSVPPLPQIFIRAPEVGADFTDNILDESVDPASEGSSVNAVTSTDNAPNPHYYVGYIPDDIPERIRPFVVDTTVGVDVAGNNLPDNFDCTTFGPSTSNQMGGGGGSGAPVNYDIEDNSDTDTASGTDEYY